MYCIALHSALVGAGRGARGPLDAPNGGAQQRPLLGALSVRVCAVCCVEWSAGCSLPLNGSSEMHGYRLGGVIVSLTYNGDAQLDLKHRALAFGSLAASVLFGAVCMQLVRKRPRRLSSASPDAPDSADASTSTESTCTANHSLNGLLWFNRAEFLTFAAGLPNEFARSPSDQSLSERNERVNVSAATEHTNLNSDGRANTPRTMCSLALNAFRTPHSLLALIIIIDRWGAEFNTVQYGRVHQLSGHRSVHQQRAIDRRRDAAITW